MGFMSKTVLLYDGNDSHLSVDPVARVCLHVFVCECTIRVVVLCICIYAHIKTYIKRKISAQVWVLINLIVLCNSMLQSKE